MNHRQLNNFTVTCLKTITYTREEQVRKNKTFERDI